MCGDELFRQVIGIPMGTDCAPFLDAFGFKVVNFPDLTGNIPMKQSYGVFVSQLIRYARCCQDFKDFRTRTLILVKRLVKQHFDVNLLRRTFQKFAESYYELLAKYSARVCSTCFLHTSTFLIVVSNMVGGCNLSPTPMTC